MTTIDIDYEALCKALTAKCALDARRGTLYSDDTSLSVFLPTQIGDRVATWALEIVEHNDPWQIEVRLSSPLAQKAAERRNKLAASIDSALDLDEPGLAMALAEKLLGLVDNRD